MAKRTCDGRSDVTDAPDGRQGVPGSLRHAHSQGCNQRGHSRLVPTSTTATIYAQSSAPHLTREWFAIFQSIIGARRRHNARMSGGPTTACLRRRRLECHGDFPSFRGRSGGRLVGVEAAGRGLESGEHSASSTRRARVLTVSELLLQDETAMCIRRIRSPGLTTRFRTEHSYLKRRAGHLRLCDRRRGGGSLAILSRLEGIIPALETSRAVAWSSKTRSGGNRATRC